MQEQKRKVLQQLYEKMEAKDFVLLMMIPLILISIVVYTDKNPVITGAVTSQLPQEENNIVGTYSIMPSFKAKINYNLEEEYSIIKSTLDNLIDECKSTQNVEQCIKDKSNGLNWNCEESKDESLDILYDFINKFNECISIEENGVVCRFSLDERTISKLIGIFAIILTNENQGVKIQLVHGKDTFEDYINLQNLVYTNYNDRDTLSENLNSVRMVLEYTDKKPVIKEIVGVDINSKTVPLSKTLLLYKKDKYLKFVEAPGSSFEAPTPANKIIDLPRIKGIKFCAKSQTGKQVLIYDKSDNTVKLRDIVYKFAVTFPKQIIPPKPIENLEIYDALKAENSVVLTWDKSKEEDIKSYSIYYSTKGFVDINIDDIKKDQNINKKLVLNSPIEIKDIDLKICTINPLDTTCKYSVYNNPLEKDKLYYWASKNKYIYMLTGTRDENQYNFAVTAINNDDIELNNDKSIKDNPYILTLNKNYKSFTPQDDLAPNKVLDLKPELAEEGKIKLTWKKPQKNIDGSDSIDTAKFNIYYKRIFTIQPEQFYKLDSTFNKLTTITIQEANCELIRLSCEYTIEGLEKARIYTTAITAVDTYSNEFMDNADAIIVPI